MAGRSLGIAVLLVCLPAFGQKHEPLNTSICSVAAHPSKFHNKNVRVRGTASSGMEASVLFEVKDGNWNKECGRISLEFGAHGDDESTVRFLHLFGEQMFPPRCGDEEVMQGFRHAMDPSAPAPSPCSNVICLSCSRYRIVATFVGKLRYSGRERGHLGFGHMGMFDLQLDVASVYDIEVTDTTASPKQ